MTIFKVSLLLTMSVCEVLLSNRGHKKIAFASRSVKCAAIK